MASKALAWATFSSARRRCFSMSRLDRPCSASISSYSASPWASASYPRCMASSQVSSLHSDIAHHPRQVHEDLLAWNDRCRGEYAKRGCFAPRPAGRAGRLATTSSGAYDPAQVLWSGGGRLTRLVELAPPPPSRLQLSGQMAASKAEEVNADAERVRAHPDRGRQGRPCRPGAP